MQTQEATTGLGVGVGVGVNVDLGPLKSSMGDLFQALSQTGGAVTDVAGQVIGTVREVGIDALMQLVKEGSEEAMQLVGSLYAVMKEAGARGVQEAGELASTIARKLDEVGYTIKSHDCGCKH
jgi:hypothetical protein